MQEVEDSDDWLNIDAQDFENVLEKTMGAGNQSHAMNVDMAEGRETLEDRTAKEQATRLQKLAEKVEEFVEGEGDLDGARFEEYANGLFRTESIR
jgi:SGT1 protein